jgi:hypothetical protein
MQRFVKKLMPSWFKNAGAARRRSTAKKQTARLTVEALEDRLVPTVVFQPHFAGESVVSGQGTGLNSATVFLLFEGSYWTQTAAGQQDKIALTNAAQSVINSPYFSALSQYTANQGNVQPIFGGSFVDGTALPVNFAPATVTNQLSWTTNLDGDVVRAFTTLGLPQSASPTPIYVIVTDPNVTSGAPGWGGYNEAPDAATGNRHQVWASTQIFSGRSNVDTDSFTLTLSHELAESLSGAVAFNAQLAPFSVSNPQSGIVQIGDEEPNTFSPTVFTDYSARLATGALVQAYWSQRDHAFVVADGNALVDNRQPIWGVNSFGDAFYTGTWNSLSPPAPPAPVAPPTYQLQPGGILQQVLGGVTTTIDTGVRSFVPLPDGSLYDLHYTGVASLYKGGTSWVQLATAIQSIAAGNDGDVYVLGTLSSGGNLLRYRSGVQDAAFHQTGVQSMAVGSDKVVYVLLAPTAGQTLGTLERFPNGVLDSVFKYPGVQSIAAGNDGAVYVLFGPNSSNPMSLYRIKNETWDQTFALGPVQSIAQEDNGNIYVLHGPGANSNELFRLRNGTFDNTFGSLFTLYGGYSGVQSIAAGNDGNVYVLFLPTTGQTSGNLYRLHNGGWERLVHCASTSAASPACNRLPRAATAMSTSSSPPLRGPRGP